VNSPPH